LKTLFQAENTAAIRALIKGSYFLTFPNR